MTERLYYNAPGLLDFEATILQTAHAAGKWQTRLDQSAFYPTSGGQLHDIGTLGATEVVEVVESEDGDVVHVTAEAPGAVGDRVRGLVDAPRRRANRQCHTAQHIISGAFARLHNLRTMSVHLGLEYGNVEVPAESLSAEQLAAVERLANDVIDQNLPVEIRFVDASELHKLPMRKIPERTGMLRIIKIGEFDYSACGGTHCDRTSEIGLIKLIGVDRIRGRCAVRFLSGQLAVHDYVQRFDATDAVSKSLTCHVTDISGRVSRLQAEIKDLRRQVTALQKRQLPALATELAAQAALVNGRQWVVEAVADVSPEVLGPLASQVAELAHGVVVLLCEDRLVLATAPESGAHAGKIVGALAERIGGKGGGSERLAQMGGVESGKLGQYKDLLVSLADNA